MFIVRADRKRILAFTLLEVTLAVTILAMMSFVIYRFVQTNIVAMRVSAAAEATDARYDGLRELLTQQMQGIPPGTGGLLGDALRVNDRDRDEMTWLCSAGPGLLTRYATGDYRVSLRLRAHDSKTNQLDLGILRKPKDDPAVSNEQETWIRLIDNFSNCQISNFYKSLKKWFHRSLEKCTSSITHIV